jgi:glucose/mannose-6-phosphate isomerase
VHTRGESRLAQMLSALHFGDYVSFYLAIAYGVDPSPVQPITWLKEQLS